MIAFGPLIVIVVEMSIELKKRHYKKTLYKGTEKKELMFWELKVGGHFGFWTFIKCPE